MRDLLAGHRAGVALSLLMVLAESVGWVAMPFVIGVAIDDFLRGSTAGLVLLGAVGLATLLLASGRRLHDVRLYARIYERAGVALAGSTSDLSTVTARLTMLREAVDFAEHSMPTLIGSATTFIGSLVFLAALNASVFVAALVVTVLIAAIYAATSGRTLRLNVQYNDELEEQVDVLRRREPAATRRHLGLLNLWTIRLSDIDAVNFALAYALTIALQIYAIVTSASRGIAYGVLLSIVLYVFEFAEGASLLPDSWQEYLRLRAIVASLGASPDE